MHATLKINYSWEVANERDKSVRLKHRDLLHESALCQISENIAKGKFNGTLSDKIKINNEDKEETTYSGWWEGKLTKKIGK